MDLTCEACQATIHIPDERVPQGATFRVTCPRCKQRIITSGRKPEGTADGRGEVSQPTVPGPSIEASSDLAIEPFGPLRPGQRAGLVCVENGAARTGIQAMLEERGYLVDVPPTPEHALHRLRFSQWHVIILEDTFGGTTPSPVLSYLKPLTMNIRREMFVVLIGERFKTADHMQAFVNSVELVLHPADLPQLGTLVERGLSEREQFYRVLNECLIAAGKKI